MLILGFNAYRGDVAAALVDEGRIVAAVEEERFSRIKHVAGFPAAAMRACLDMAAATQRPEEAIDCFLRIDMDVLVIGRHLVEKASIPA